MYHFLCFHAKIISIFLTNSLKNGIQSGIEGVDWGWVEGLEKVVQDVVYHYYVDY
jgi:hypothetical protein